MIQKSHVLTTWALWPLVGLSLVSCGSDRDPSHEQVGSTASEVTIYEYADSSGKIHVRIRLCDQVYYGGGQNTEVCPTDPGYVMVGGGAETQGDYGLLQASYDGLGGWRANAKDHCAAGAYPLRAYSIGLRVDGLTQAQLNQFMTFNEAYSVPAQHPSVKAYVPPGFQLIGGYAWAGELGWSPTGQLLVASAAGNDVNGDYWYAESKDHCVAVSASVYAAVIGITNDPIPGVGLIHRSFWNNVVYCPGGFCTATISVGSGHALTSVGAWGSYNGAGRLLTQLVPFANWPAGTGPGATVKSKDHVSGDSGNLGAQWVGIWADP